MAYHEKKQNSNYFTKVLVLQMKLFYFQMRSKFFRNRSALYFLVSDCLSNYGPWLRKVWLFALAYRHTLHSSQEYAASWKTLSDTHLLMHISNYPTTQNKNLSFAMLLLGPASQTTSSEELRSWTLIQVKQDQNFKSMHWSLINFLGFHCTSCRSNCSCFPNSDDFSKLRGVEFWWGSK